MNNVYEINKLTHTITTKSEKELLAENYKTDRWWYKDYRNANIIASKDAGDSLMLMFDEVGITVEAEECPKGFKWWIDGVFAGVIPHWAIKESKEIG